MTPTELQLWLGTHGQPVVVDGKPGPVTRAAIIAAFTNTCANAVTDSQIAAYALRLGCTAKQLRAVATVESGGSAYDAHGRPKILFERHLFSRLTAGKYDVCAFSNPDRGGYNEDSWEKLTLAACKDADAAFSACSWGKFQVLGAHWRELNYVSPIELAYSTVTGEAAHYELLVRFIEAEGLKTALKALSDDPETCRAFASRFNGPSYRQFDYHAKLARAMR